MSQETRWQNPPTLESSEHIKNWKKKILESQPLGMWSLESEGSLWWQRLNGFSNMMAGPEAVRRKARKAQFPIFEFLLAKWVDAAEYARVPVTDDVLRAQSLVVQDHLTKIGCEEIYSEFTMSNGWLQKFKERHLIGRLKRHGEAGSVDLKALPSQRAEIRHQLRSFALQDIWNCDESGLQYNKQPAYSNVRKEAGKVLPGVKLDKTWVTTFHVTNVDGSEKRKLLVIGRTQTPQAFPQNKINISNLPVTYRFNKKAWMLSSLWFEFLRILNEEMRIQGRNIALLSDNCPSHSHPNSPPENYEGPIPPSLTNITLIYLPPNTTSHLQPLDPGIIASFKSAYRRQYANYMVSYFNANHQAPPKLNILSAIGLMAEAWEAIPAATIQNCWKHSGLIGAVNDPVHSSTQSYTAEPFIQQAESETRVSLRSLNPDLNPNTFHDDFYNFFYFNDVEESEESKTSTTPNAISLVEEYVKLGLLTLGPEKMNLTDLDAPGDDIEASQLFQSPPITTAQAVNSLHSITRYLQSLPVSTLSTPAGRLISIPTVVQTTTSLVSALSLYAHLSLCFPYYLTRILFTI